ncbi:hypothetical protein BDV23DRAFT_178576 [Aspergillus alliaceus]|uniref:Uncharacterized protein n=1 Tax=Petromyces alliaceus TaxID=209559 RepID=A0A5N7CN40_PETAA|nr:hypothetical protein BDV23DRAFT_178576 [Aspergillus alliaceus]
MDLELRKYEDTESVNTTATEGGPRSPPSWNWEPDCQDGTKKEGYKKHLEEQMYCRFSGLDTTYLTQILKNTRNCRTLILDDRNWPWGAAHIKRETGCYPSLNANSDYSKAFFKQAVHVLIAAMTASGIPIMDLAINTHLERIHVQPTILVFPTPCLNHAPWVTTLATLQLTVDPGYGQEPAAWSKPLADFIMLFPQLNCLDLYFDTRVEQPAFHALSELLMNFAPFSGDDPLVCSQPGDDIDLKRALAFRTVLCRYDKARRIRQSRGQIPGPENELISNWFIEFMTGLEVRIKAIHGCETICVWCCSHQQYPMASVGSKGLHEVVRAAVPLQDPNYRRVADDKTVHPDGAILVDLAVHEEGLRRVLR